METLSSDNKKQQQHTVNDKEAQTCILSYDCNNLRSGIYDISKASLKAAWARLNICC